MKRPNDEKLKQMRFDRLVLRLSSYKRDLAERLSETRRLFKHKLQVVDIHIHTNYSDGAGTVQQAYACAKSAGLDFVFITDHRSLGQKRIVSRLAQASWGQEPAIRDDGSARWMHHIGLLCGSRRFRPGPESVAEAFERAKTIAPFVWIPHPVGWYPSTWYAEESIKALWTLSDGFAMEIMNGANKAVRAFDCFDEKVVTVWDRLLCDGKKVTAVAGSDAHIPDDIGSTWTGVLGGRRTAGSIIKALNEGRCFASESTLMDFTCSGQPMGATIRKKQGANLVLRFRVADAAGLTSVRIISQGRTVKEIQANGKKLIEGTYKRKVGARKAYYRLESTAGDDRRAFSTPIYVETI